MSWLTDTLVATGALIALVLVLRGPVSRLFGPGVAYALWALPILRLLLPPLLLPAPPQSAAAPVSPAVADLVVEFEPAAAAPAWSLFELFQAVWLAGVIAYLGWRFWQYAAMRRTLLAHARPVGEVGAVRLVESPAAKSPVAFGLRDKVVALPPGFIDNPDRTGRDLAIEHELEHHAGRDLAVNIAVQPLLALHWFNPLAWLAWRALRRDQEAACDARVLAGRDGAMRAAYGQLIVRYAGAPQLAMAAPLACPMLREKSIVHRLRSLTMNQPSLRRRLVGRTLIGAAILALPATATVVYAAAEAQPAPPQPPAAPAAPAAPEAPAVHLAKKIVIVETSDGRDKSDARLKTRVIERDGKTIVIKTDKELSEAEIEARVTKAEKSLAESDIVMLRHEGDEPDAGKGPKVEKRVMILRSHDGPHAAMAFADGHAAIACTGGDPAVDIDESGAKEGKSQAVRIKICSAGQARADAQKHALSALKQARDNIKDDEKMSAEIRAKVLERLDAKIAELSKAG